MVLEAGRGRAGRQGGGPTPHDRWRHRVTTRVAPTSVASVELFEAVDQREQRDGGDGPLTETVSA